MKSKKQPKSDLHCGYCGKEFKYESERKRHEQSHSPQFECKICFKKFSFLSAVRRHEKQHERTGTVECKECNRKFRDEPLLKRHIKYAHKGTSTCGKCGTTFSSELALRSHSKTHKPLSERRFRCGFPSCGKSFNFAHHLKHHELTHTNIKQHHCNVCGKGFIQSHHLKSHMKTHETEDLFKCDEFGCKKTFTTEYAVKKHIGIHNTVICSSCKQVLLREQYKTHLSNCITNKQVKSQENTIRRQDSLRNKDNNLSHEHEQTIDDDGVRTCKSYIGGCIAQTDANDNNNKCLCADISMPTVIEENVEFLHDNNYVESLTINNSNNYNEDVNIKEGHKSKPIGSTNVDCEGCECFSIKSNVYKIKNSSDKFEESVIEYRSDGTVKIRETSDFDVQICTKVTKDIESVPYNSCKAVLGNCIVSGDGTIGEGCLCARMAIEDQQILAQEIEDLTPCPRFD